MQLLVKTGHMKGAGTDANVYVTLVDEEGNVSEKKKLDKLLHDDLERGTLDDFSIKVSKDFGKVRVMLVERDNKGLRDDWFCEYIIVQDPREIGKSNLRKIKSKNKCCPGIDLTCVNGKKVEYYFPIQRWISHEYKYEFHEFITTLPQFDPTSSTRCADLEKRKECYQFKNKVENGPAQIADLPSDEQFSEQYFWTFASEKVKLIGQCKFINATSPKWKSLADLSSVYKHSLGEPDCLTVWREDWWFGTQRIQGVNPVIIQLCKEIPDKLDVTEETVGCFLEGLSLEEALQTNKIFICDLEILEGINCPENRILATPIALFYLNKENKLMPIAIQLFQQKGDDNPVYTPNDSENTWLVAKMYYNNCEAQHHQALTHLGLTHLLMEGVCICTNRNLSPSHPMFKLMAPHFLYLLAINSRGLEKLVNPGGWVDCCMTQGVQGIFQLMIKGFDTWHYDTHSTPEKSLTHRGVLDENILPYYPYREDALPLHRAIENYVTKIVYHYYDSPDKIENDLELRMWRLELARERDNCGVGLKGLPGCDETGFHDAQEIIDVVAFIISTCSLGHAASNFQQYEQYGFVPNYAGLLTKDPPREKKEYTETDIMALLPNKEKTLDIMVITKLLSLRGTKSLGDFEMQYLYHPQDVQAAEEFRNELKELHEQLELKEQKRFWKFPYLDPMLVPNSISV